MNTLHLSHFLDTLLNEYTKNSPGFSLGIFQGSTPIHIRSVGVSNRETGEMASEKTNYRLASVSKQFTAMAVLQLVDKGKIALDDPLYLHFPSFSCSKDITIFHLLTHSSGIRDFEDFLSKGRKRPISDKEVLQIVSTKTPYFPAGSSWRYSNSGYCILKELIEKISGKRFPQYIQKHIFEPLDMNTSIVSERGKTDIRNRAIGYSINKNGSVYKTDNNVESYTMGDGSIYSNTEDLILWMTKGKGLLSEKMQRVLETSFIETDEQSHFYGFGINKEQVKGYWVLCHEGYSIGFRTSILHILEKDINIIFLSNLHENEGSFFTEKIAEYFV